jgi:hypothetical protein
MDVWVREELSAVRIGVQSYTVADQRLLDDGRQLGK